MAPPDGATRYVVDASAWIEIEGHRAQNLILKRVGELIEAGLLECPPQAWAEVKRCPEVLARIGQYEDQMVMNLRSNPAYLVLVGEIHHKHPQMCGARGRKNKGDGYVLANAIFGNGASTTKTYAVVASEGFVGRGKLGKACLEHGIKYLSLIQMLAREFPDDGW